MAAVSEAGWATEVYGTGWSAKQLFCHIAADSSIAGMLIALAKMPAGARAPAPEIEVDDWNARQVANRQDKPIEELLEELRRNVERDIQLVRSEPDETFALHFRAPWGEEGLVSDLIMKTISGHFLSHLADLRAAAG